jgi:hypothetical protein
MLCTLPEVQLVDVTILAQLLRHLLQPGETDACDAYCCDRVVRQQLLQALLSLPAVSSFSRPTVQSLMNAAVQAAHLPFVVLLAERLHVPGHEIHLSQEQLVVMLRHGATNGDATGMSLLTSTPTARDLTTQDLQDVLVAAMAPRHTDNNYSETLARAWPGAWYGSGSVGSRTQVEPNRAAAIGLLMRLPAAAALPTRAVAALLKQSIAQGHADTARELLALPAAQLDTQVLEQQCLHCADDDAVQYKDSWRGQKTVLEALLQHPVAKQFGLDTLQRLVSAFVHPAPLRYGTEFHPLALVLGLPMVQGLDSAALLGLVTTCIEAHVPVHSITAALAAPAASEWSAAQVKGLLLAAARARHAKALDQVLRRPAAPAATDPDVQLCRALFSAENYKFWLPVPEQPAYPSYHQSYDASPVDRYCCYCS